MRLVAPATHPAASALWAGTEPLFEAILAGPFVARLADGTLPAANFATYTAQDVFYLQEYGPHLEAIAALAPPEEAGVWREHAAGCAQELEMHRKTLRDGPDDDGPDGDDPGGGIVPATRAYLDFLDSVVGRGSYLEAMAAVVPCSWLYGELGMELAAAGSVAEPHPYSAWIDLYSGQDYLEDTRATVDFFERALAEAPREEALRAAGIFNTAMWLELEFFAAHRP